MNIWSGRRECSGQQALGSEAVSAGMASAAAALRPQPVSEEPPAEAFELLLLVICGARVGGEWITIITSSRPCIGRHPQQPGAEW